MFVGIDPGQSGGFAWIEDPAHRKVECVKMPDTPADILDLVRRLHVRSLGDLCVFMEKVGFHRQGNSASSSAKFARHCGHLEMALLAEEVEVVMVSPSRWMRSFLGTVPKDKKERKNRVKSVAQQRCPYLGKHVTLATADAIGILLSQTD